MVCYIYLAQKELAAREEPSSASACVCLPPKRWDLADGPAARPGRIFYPNSPPCSIRIWEGRWEMRQFLSHDLPQQWLSWHPGGKKKKKSGFSD